MRLTRILLAGIGLTLAACSTEHESDEHAGHDMSEMSGEMDHSKHMAGPLTEKALKDKKEAAELLVERFDIEACAKADLIGSLRRTSPEEGETLMRAYKAPVACAEQALAAAKKLGFTEGEAGTFASASSDGTAEEIKIAMIAEEDAATIEWQAVQK